MHLCLRMKKKMEKLSGILVHLLHLLLVSHAVEFGSSHQIHRQSHESLPTEQHYRTSYHFQPPKNWMNDPNGPMYYNGVYHLFYQYNPYGAVWGNIVWAHSVSYDLVNWVHLDHAIYPTEPFDINGCWSGSATILPGNIPVILYTGIDTERRQVQNLAMPKNLSDPFLTEWVKSPHNPLMSPIDGIDPNLYRDPTTAWLGQDKEWRLIIGSQKNGHGIAILYRSTDFVNWTRSDNFLHSSNKTEMWECPDFYPVRVNGKSGLDTSVQSGAIKHVLKASFNHHDYYIIGNYELKGDRYLVKTDFMDDDSQLRYDYGKFYASKTFFDSAKKRRILWGWINESDSESDDILKGWSGLQSIPRRIFLSKNSRQLVQWPVEEIKKLRVEQVSLHDIKLEGGSVFEVAGITASQADVELSFDLPSLKEVELMNSSSSVDPLLLCSKNKASKRGVVGPFGLLVLASKDLSEHTAIFFRIFKRHGKNVVLMCSDQSRSSLGGFDKTTYGAFVDIDPSHEKIKLRSLIDHSIVESFGGEGKTCITARVYPQLALGEAARLHVFNNGTQGVKISRLHAWSMKKAQIAPIQK